MKTKEMIYIPAELHSTELLCSLHPNNFETDESKHTANLLHKICFASLTSFHKSELIDDLILTEDEKNIVILNNWKECKNIEIKARTCDVLRRFDKDKRQITIDASNCYFEGYSKFKNIEFLIRAITVRNIKVINDDTFLDNVLSVIDEDIHPSWLNKLIVALLKSYPVEKIASLTHFVIKQIKNSVRNSNFEKERKYIEVLFSLEAINEVEFHKQLALSYEREADQTIKNKKPNTYYPRLPDIFKNAYNEIFKIKNNEPKIYNRIKKKLIIEQKRFVDLLSIYGPKIKFDVPNEIKKQIADSVKKIQIKSCFDVIKILLEIPFTTIEEVDKYRFNCQTSPISSFFGHHNQLNRNGNTIGHADSEKSLKTEAHIYFRQWRLHAMWTYITLLKWAKIDINSNTIYFLLEKNKPQFITEDNLILWEKGITAGLNMDFITATHILMPQLEHSLHNIAEIKNGTITYLENKRQEEPSLGKILPLLKGVINEEVLFEIESFLQGGIDVNFRNNLSHGLFSTFEIDKHGIYLWWICLKIYFCNDFYIDA